MHILVAIVATLALLPWLATPSQASERTVARMGGLQATISQTTQWCGETVEIHVRAADAAQLSGNDTRQLQLLAGGVRQILGLECPAIQQLQLIGSVHGQTIGTWTHTAEGQLIAGQTVTPPASAVQSTPIGREEIAETQQMLSELGYQPGPVDGLMGRQTRSAITAFQRDRRQTTSGRLTPELLGQLRHDYCGNPLGCDGPTQAKTDTGTSSARALAQEGVAVEGVPVSESTAQAESHEIPFATLPEPDHQAMLRLYMAANGNILDNDAFAWEYFRVFHIEPTDGSRHSEECRNLRSRYDENEFERQRINTEVRSALQDGLMEARNWPTTRTFRVSWQHNLGAYDHERQGFPLVTEQTRNQPPIFGGETPIPRSTANQRDRAYYRGPTQHWCYGGPGPSDTHFLDGRDTLPNARGSSLALSFPSDERLAFLPMPPPAAERLLQSLGNHRTVIVEGVIEAGPASLQPGARRRGVVPTKHLVVRIVHPETEGVIHHFDLSPPASEAILADEESEREPSDEITRETDPILAPYHFAYLLMRDRPDLLTEENLISMVQRQIQQEQRCLATIDEIRLDPRRLQMSGLNPERPALMPSWQEMMSESESPARGKLLELFASPRAKWSFISEAADIDQRFAYLVEAFLFSETAIRDRDPRFASHELAPIFKHLLMSVSEQAPRRFQATFPLPPAGYDFQQQALRFRQGGFSEEFVAAAPLIPLADNVPEVSSSFLYVPFPHGRREADSVEDDIAHCSRTASPSRHWRERIGELNRAASPVLALARELTIGEVEMSPGEAEDLLGSLDHQGLGLQAKVTLQFDEVEIIEGARGALNALHHARLEGIEILRSDGSLLTRLPTSAFQTAEQQTASQAEFESQYTPGVDPETASGQADAETLDLLTFRHLPDSVDESMLERMLHGRWHYENSLLSQGQPRSWGDFFIRQAETRPTIRELPNADEEKAEMLANFRSWSLQRADTLPEQFTLFWDIYTIQAGLLEYPSGLSTEDRNYLNSRQARCQRAKASNMRDSSLEFQGCDDLEAALQVPVTRIVHVNPFQPRAIGPRNSCGSAIPGQDSYCQGMRNAPQPSDIGMIQDIFEVDRLIRISEEAAQAAGQRVMIQLTAEVTNVNLLDEIPLHPWLEAAKPADQGQIHQQSRSNDPSPRVHYWSLNMLSAQLVDSRSGDVIAQLDLESPPATPQADKTNDKKTTDTTETSSIHATTKDPDILGIHLGMSFEEAEALIQAHMEVGLEAVADRKWQTGSAIGNISLLNSARLFLSSDQRESIILYDEPPAAEGIVMGVARQILLPADTIPPSTIIGELQNIYGSPDVVDNSMLGEGLMIWGDASVFTRSMSPHVVQDCLPISTNKHLSRGWRHLDDSPFGVAELEQRSRQPFSALTPITHIQMEQVTRLAEICEGGKALAAIFSPTRHRHRQGITAYDTLNIWLFDLSTYAKTHISSLQTTDTETADVEKSSSGIKF